MHGELGSVEVRPCVHVSSVNKNKKKIGWVNEVDDTFREIDSADPVWTIPE
jgi:hypothetical protein